MLYRLTRGQIDAWSAGHPSEQRRFPPNKLMTMLVMVVMITMAMIMMTMSMMRMVMMMMMMMIWCR